MYKVFLIVVSADEAELLIAAPACEGSFNLIGPASSMSLTDRAPARIAAATKPIDAASIMSMTMIAADHMLISAMMDGPFIRFG